MTMYFFIKLFIIGETIFHICFHYIYGNMEHGTSDSDIRNMLAWNDICEVT